MVPLLIGGGLAAGGAVASYMGGKSAADQQKKAQARWQAQRKALLDSLMKDQYSQGREHQAGTTDYLSKLTATMGQPATVAPTTAEYAPAVGDATGPRDADWQAVYRSAMAPKAAVNDAQLSANQANMDMGSMQNLLQQLGYGSELPARVADTQHGRFAFKNQMDQAANDAELAGFHPSNGSYNLQLLGQIMSGVGGGVLSAAPFMGGAPTSAAGAMNGRTAGNVNLFNAAAR